MCLFSYGNFFFYFQMNSLIVGLSLLNYIGCVQIGPPPYGIVQQNLPLQSHATYYPSKATYYNYDTSPARTFLSLGAKSLFGCVIYSQFVYILDKCRVSHFTFVGYQMLDRNISIFFELPSTIRNLNAFNPRRRLKQTSH